MNQFNVLAFHTHSVLRILVYTTGSIKKALYYILSGFFESIFGLGFWQYKQRLLHSPISKMYFDRIEENIAVLLFRDEEKIKINIPLFLLPLGSKEGDILSIAITRDVQETEAAKERVSSLLEKLKKKN
jgi:hypothetical protein